MQPNFIWYIDMMQWLITLLRHYFLIYIKGNKGIFPRNALEKHAAYLNIKAQHFLCWRWQADALWPPTHAQYPLKCIFALLRQNRQPCYSDINPLTIPSGRHSKAPAVTTCIWGFLAHHKNPTKCVSAIGLRKGINTNQLSVPLSLLILMAHYITMVDRSDLQRRQSVLA